MLKNNHVVPENARIYRRSARLDFHCHTATFAEIMAKRLWKHRRKDGWEDADVHYLFRRLLEEVAELYSAYHELPAIPNHVQQEAADVANFAMMIAERGNYPK